MSAESNKTVVRRFYDLYQAGSYDEAEKLFDPRCVIHQPGLGDLNVKAYRRVGEEYRSAFPDNKFIIDDLISEGDQVVARLTFRGTHRGILQGIAPTNRQVVSPGVSIFHFSPDGKIIEAWNEYDQLDLMMQLGVMKAPQSAAR